MSIFAITVCLLAVSGFLNQHLTNAKSFGGVKTYSKNESDLKSHPGAPMQQFQALDGDWLKKLQNEDFHEVETDDNKNKKHQKATMTTTTPASLGFDFKYLFNKNKKDAKEWNHHQQNSNPDPQNRAQNEKSFQPNLDNNNPFGQDQLKPLDFDPQAMGGFGVPPFDPFSPPFMQVPNFLNLNQNGYARSQMTVPLWAGRGYSNRFGYQLPQFFSRRFGY